MNIFYLHQTPEVCARHHVDKHVVKMIVEYAQILSTTHRFLDGVESIESSNTGKKTKRLKLPDERDLILYQATHVNHPSTIWARKSVENYNWLFQLFSECLKEYTFRYGKSHKTSSLLNYLKSPPNNIMVDTFTEPTPAMPEECIKHSAIASYRYYYISTKHHMFSWKNRETPEWIKDFGNR